MVDAIAVGVPIEPLARYFEYWLLRLQGVYEARPAAFRGSGRFSPRRAARSPFGLAEVAVSPRALRELEASHRALIAMHLEKDLKSARVLRNAAIGGPYGIAW